MVSTKVCFALREGGKGGRVGGRGEEGREGREEEHKIKPLLTCIENAIN